MRQFEHLQEYEITLTTVGPVFIGSGEKYGKNDYIYDKENNMVSILDRNKFFQFLIERDLIDKYETFILKRSGRGIGSFLRTDCRIQQKDITPLICQRLSAAAALDGEHSLKEIEAFVQTKDGQYYIPGSSLKGCLRTVLLTNYILKDDHRPSVFGKMEYVEQKYLHTLHRTAKQENAINSIMQGISISDSAPIEESNMILAGKVDSFLDSSENVINLVRQCVAPKTKISFRLTLDQSVLHHKIDIDMLREAVQTFDQFYINEYHSHFDFAKENEDLFLHPFLVLGGGSGFFGKNLVYPLHSPNHKAAVKQVADYMQNTFKKHGHEYDVEDAMSPHMYKITGYAGEDYPFGLCQVEFQ